jgi:type VI secretion system protein ImpA
MVRGLRWGELRAGGHTLEPRLLAAPPTATRTKLKGLLLDGAWSRLLEAGEQVMASPFGRGWLGLQRYILTATDSLGGEYEPVGQAIRGALRALLQDLPELPEATLMDDTSTANRETRSWLKEEGLYGDFSEGAEEEMARPARTADEGRPGEGVARVLQRARSEAQGGRHPRAIKLLQDRTAREPTHRGRFILRTETAAVMLEAGHDAVALPILRELYEESQATQTLTAWEEPTLVARPMALLYRCARRLEDTSVDSDGLYLEVCRLDPVMAIDLRDMDKTPAETPEETMADG